LIDSSIAQKLREANRKISKRDFPPKFLRKIVWRPFRNFDEESPLVLKSPITAVVGKNGTGKSTVLFLAGAAFAPPAKQKRTKGRTFNYFIPESAKDQVTIGSEYGFVHDDGFSPRLKWIERGKEGGRRAGTREWDPRGDKGKRKERNTAFLGYEKTIASPFWISNYFDPKPDFIAGKLEGIGQGNPVELDPKTVKVISNIVQKEYSSIHRCGDDTLLGDSSLGYIVDNQYSDLACGAGEIAVIRMVDTICSADDNSLILIDEPESGLHQVSQERLLEFFINRCLSRNHQMIFTTHSRVIIGQLPVESIVLMRRVAGRIVSEPANSSMALKEITDRRSPKIMAVVEDGFAADITQAIVDMDPRTRSLVDVYRTDFEGSDQMLRLDFLRRFYNWQGDPQNKLKPVFILDGDQRDKIDFAGMKPWLNHKQVEREFKKNYDRSCRKISKLFSLSSGRLNFKNVFENQRYKDVKRLAKLTAEYLDHFTNNSIFLPGKECPESMILEWLYNQYKSQSPEWATIEARLPKDQTRTFKNLISDNKLEFSSSKKCKSTWFEIRNLQPKDISESIVDTWALDSESSSKDVLIKIEEICEELP